MTCVGRVKTVVTNHLREMFRSRIGSAQRLMCVVINNSSYPTFKNNTTAYHAFGKYRMQARGVLNYRLKYCWLKVIYCIYLGLPDGRYFTSNLAGAVKRPVF